MCWQDRDLKTAAGCTMLRLVSPPSPFVLQLHRIFSTQIMPRTMGTNVQSTLLSGTQVYGFAIKHTHLTAAAATFVMLQVHSV